MTWLNVPNTEKRLHVEELQTIDRNKGKFQTIRNEDNNICREMSCRQRFY